MTNVLEQLQELSILLELARPHEAALLFEYTNHRGESARRRLLNGRLVYTGAEHPYYPKAWVVRGWCLDRKELRDFAVSTMTAVCSEYVASSS